MKQKKTCTSYLLIITIFLQSFSFLSIKLSTIETGIFAFALLIAAFIFIGLRSILWQHLLIGDELSKIYPYTSLVQILILIYAVFLFNEPIAFNNLIGLVMMLSGIFYMSR